MIPEHRLAVLLDQLKQSQVSKCLYHNPSRAPSLFTDHICDRSQFPLQTIAELDKNDGEVWCLEFSHNGKSLAAGDSETGVIIYDVNSFAVRHSLRGHERGVVHVSWSPDDSRLITCSKDHTAKVWDIEVKIFFKCSLTALKRFAERELCRKRQPSQPCSHNSCLGT